jgi:hypothetical protein
MAATAALAPCTVLVSLNQKRRLALVEDFLRSARIELIRAQTERDQLREAMRHAALYIRNGRIAAALDVLERAARGHGFDAADGTSDA